VSRWARALRVAAPALATVALLWFVVRHVGVEPLVLAVRAADPGWLAAAVLWNAAIHVGVPAEKFRRILGRLGHRLTLAETARIWLGCQPLRFFMPLKSGELFKVLYLRSVHGVPPGVGTWGVLIDKLTNFIALAAFAVAGALAGATATPFSRAAWPLVAVLLMVMGGVLAAPVPRWLEQSAARWPARVGRFASELAGATRHLGAGAKLGFLAISTGQVLTEGIGFWLCLRALGASVPLGGLWLRAPLVILAANLPVTISGIGTRELAMVVVLGGAAPAATLAAAGILVSLVGPVLLAVLGLPFVARFLAQSLDASGGGESLGTSRIRAVP